MGYYRYDVCPKGHDIHWDETSLEMYSISEGYSCSDTQPALVHDSYYIVSPLS